MGVVRSLLRAMGEAEAAGGQPVEPPEQTALADATAALQGVLAAGVPGAGGFDALFAIVDESPGLEGGAAAAEEEEEGGRAAAAAERLWLGWPGGGLTPLLLRDGPAAGHPGAGLQGRYLLP